jgi:histidinol-phosphatase (PHP family)
MKANYHTHTWRCNHAAGNEKQYVENALKAGLELLGFADHTPYIFAGDYYSGFRMAMEQLPGYVDTVLLLREEYAGRIEIPLGLETEYYPRHFEALLSRLREHPMDYLILGQHCLGDEVNDHYSGRATADKKHMERYCDQACDAMQTGLFTYFAHPDLLNYVGDDRRFWKEQVRRICREAKQCGIPLEINLLGMLCKKHYPNPEFWALAAEEGCSVVLGLDAHDPSHVENYECEAKALEMVRHYGLKLLETVELKRI